MLYIWLDLAPLADLFRHRGGAACLPQRLRVPNVDVAVVQNIIFCHDRLRMVWRVRAESRSTGGQIGDPSEF